jgi:pantetheine-phosphate adenylyltransferase
MREKAKNDRLRYAVVAMGGTFDVLHLGHRQLLRQAFSIGKTVIIGVTSDAFARSLHKPHKIDPYQLRKKHLEKTLQKWGVLSRARIVELTDRYGPTVDTSRIQALVVSERTINAAYTINKMRKTRGLRALTIVPIKMVLAQDKRAISSTRIRHGKIDRQGRTMLTKS